MKTNFLRVAIFASLTSLIFSCSDDKINQQDESTAISKTVSNRQRPLRELFYPIGLSSNPSTWDANPRATQFSRGEFNSLTMRIFNDSEYYGGGSSSSNWGTVNYFNTDKFNKFAADNGFLRVHGHSLVYHLGLAPGQPDYIRNQSAATVEQRLKEYIQNLLGRYRNNGKQRSYDVINEVIANGGGTYDNTIYRQKFSSDEDYYQFIKRLFSYAKDADPDAKMFYNDYGTDLIPGKRQKVINLVNRLKNETSNGRRIIDGIGVQSHVSIDTFNYGAYAADLKAASDTGLLVHISELDVSVNSNDQPWSSNPFTDARSQKQAEVYKWIPGIYYSNVAAGQRFGITVWDLSDKTSWLNTCNQRPKNCWEKPTMFWDDGWKKPAFYGLVSGILGRDVNQNSDW